MKGPQIPGWIYVLELENKYLYVGWTRVESQLKHLALGLDREVTRVHKPVRILKSFKGTETEKQLFIKRLREHGCFTASSLKEIKTLSNMYKVKLDWLNWFGLSRSEAQRAEAEGWTPEEPQTQEAASTQEVQTPPCLRETPSAFGG